LRKLARSVIEQQMHWAKLLKVQDLPDDYKVGRGGAFHDGQILLRE